MSTKIAVNLPVKDLAQSGRFFAELGFASNEQLSTENMEAIVVSDDIHVLLVVEPQFKAITKKEIPDTAATSEAVLQLQVESRQRVDELADKAFAAGALAANEPNDQGFLYGTASATRTDTTGTFSASNPPCRRSRHDSRTRGDEAGPRAADPRGPLRLWLLSTD